MILYMKKSVFLQFSQINTNNKSAYNNVMMIIQSRNRLVLMKPPTQLTQFTFYGIYSISCG